jgi:hypothetical protein
MRQAIDTAPRDGKIVILEDDASGTYDVAHWSRKTFQWVGENGEPSNITPTHWYPRPRDKYLLQEDDRSPRRSAAWSITATLIAVALIGVYFRAEVAGYVTQYAGLQDIFGISRRQVVEQETQLPSQDSRKTDLLAVQQQAEADQARAQTGAQVKQAGEAPAPEARQSLEQEQRTEVLANELAEARRTVDGLTLQLRAEAANSAQLLGREREKTAAAARQELTESAAQHRQALDEERARGAAVASELATVRTEIETQAALLRKASDETGQLKQAQAAKGAQSLAHERQKTAALAQEAAAARQELTASTAQHRQALDEERARGAVLASELATARREIETQAALLRKASDETGQLKRAAESATAELRQSLQQERDRAAAMERDLASARRKSDVRVTPEPAANSQIAKAAQAVEVAAIARPAAVETQAQGSPETTRLIARASALLGQGDIGAARVVLERAAETGSAQASFMLAETYDPAILSVWGTYGTRGEVTKAREFYAKARAGGIQEAKDRFNALRQ